MIDTINDGTLYLRGPVRVNTYTLPLGKGTCKLADTGTAARAADHGVAFPVLLNTAREADEGQLQHTKLCLLSSKTNRMVLKFGKPEVG